MLGSVLVAGWARGLGKGLVSA
jgi:hypothetical protein